MHTALRRAVGCTNVHRAVVQSCILHAARRQQQRYRCTSSAASATACAATAVYLAPAEEHLQHLAALLARHRHAGDCYCLYGSVGAGKSVFSRAFIRAAAEDATLPVPSPTYLLQLMYDEQEGPPIHHFDLYRLDPQQDMSRLDLAASLTNAVSLIEWAERMPQKLLPQQRLEVYISILDAEAAVPSSSSSSDAQEGAGQTQEQQQQQLAWHAQLQQRQQQQLYILQQQQQQDILLLPTHELQQQREQHGDVGMMDGSMRDTGEEEYEEAEDEYEELFTDKRWRLVQLMAFGESWAERVRRLAQDMQQQQQQQQRDMQRQPA